MLNDSNIIILMQMDPKTRTEFLRNTYMPGLKPKLRQFAKQMVHTPQVIENISDLKYFTVLMRFGGVPPQNVLESLPEEWQDGSSSNFSVYASDEEKQICTEFLKMYFDCGFIYGPHLRPLLSHCDHLDFELFLTVYTQLVKYEKEDLEDVMYEFVCGEHIYSIQNLRYEFWTYHMENKMLSLEKLKRYLTFDLNHLKIDSCFILEVIRRGIENDPEFYKPYFETVLNVPYPQNDMNINQSLKTFFDHLVNKAVFDSSNRIYFRQIVKSLVPYYGYMASSFFKINKTIQLNSQLYPDETQWVDDMVKKLMNHPKDLAFAFLLDHEYGV